MNTIRWIYFILLTLSFNAISANIELPDIGGSSESILSSADEEQLGRQIIHTLRQSAPLIEDPEVMQYLNELGYRLAANSNEPSQNFHFFAIQDNSINAFATPGGIVALFSGLILRSHTESELASVVAHEIAHVTQRHIARTQEATAKWSPAMLGLLVASLLLAGENPEMGQAGVMAAAAGSIQMQLNFTRTYEREADRIGMENLTRAQLDPAGMPAFFERLQQHFRYSGSVVPDFLRSHPVTTDRIAEAKDRASQLSKSLYADNPAFHLMKAKILNLVTTDPAALAKRLEKALITGQYLDQHAVRYGLLLALLDSQQADKAAKQLKWLQKNDEDRVIYRAVAARLAALQGNDALAQQIYQLALSHYPADAIISMAYAQFLLHQQQAEAAEKVLLAINSKKWPDYYRRLAAAQTAAKKHSVARASMAEFYVMNGDFKLAVEQLRQALLKPIADYHLISRIEARLKYLKAELLEIEEAEESAL